MTDQQQPNKPDLSGSMSHALRSLVMQNAGLGFMIIAVDETGGEVHCEIASNIAPQSQQLLLETLPAHLPTDMVSSELPKVN